MSNPLKLNSTLCLGAFLMLSACGTKDPVTTEDSTSEVLTTTSEETLPTGGKTETSVTAADDTTTTGATEGMTSEDPSTSTGPDTGVTTGPPACPDPEAQENGSECTDATGCGCKSEFCFLVPILGGWCGECLIDGDCGAGGCSVPNPIAGTGAVCNGGEPGAGCMTDDVCTDPDNLHCGTLLAVPGIISVATCGECASNADCADPALPNCSPAYDVANFTGQYMCVGDNTVPQDGGCNLTEEMGAPVGNAACESGFCGEANVMGLLKVGICGQCNSDEDCEMGASCVDPQVDLTLGALVGSVCM